jgi:hypothetical protein
MSDEERKSSVITNFVLIWPFSPSRLIKYGALPYQVSVVKPEKTVKKASKKKKTE